MQRQRLDLGHSPYPNLATKTKTSRGWGTRRLCFGEERTSAEAGPSAPLKSASLGMTILWDGEKMQRQRLDLRHSAYPTLATKTKTSRGWGTRRLWLGEKRTSAEAGPSAPLKSASLGMTLY